MTISYAKKADAMFKVLMANPNTSATQIYNRYKGTELGMRKSDSLELTKAFKKQIADREEYLKKIENSSAKASTKVKLSNLTKKTAYKYAKNTTKRGKALTKKGSIYDSVQGISDRTFNISRPNASGYTEFY